jgi:hypothetical protein
VQVLNVGVAAKVCSLSEKKNPAAGGAASGLEVQDELQVRANTSTGRLQLHTPFVSAAVFPSNINCLIQLKFRLSIIQWAKYLRAIINEPPHSFVGNHRLAIQSTHIANIDQISGPPARML